MTPEKRKKGMRELEAREEENERRDSTRLTPDLRRAATAELSELGRVGGVDL